ncbi:tetratricopeptide repeat protein [Robiginitalea sp. M366]|uniref:tetratricopeptide repeat protein n=1 Tax=Robiginitalea aestuariiviva TaxID=3036903 RepID=UPI00240D63D7|nr:tetratricopeptide repeat protein [Robiginitalea aestuariiviva]MDG1571187.1 tetratricopeptide repeat protein [Robiginitalea aestuariiviva]
MKSLFAFLFLLLALVARGQEDFLARQYFSDGAFEKAVVFYEKLAAENPRRTDYTERLVQCYRQMEAFDKAISYLQGRIETGTAYPTLYIDLGYTYLMAGYSEQAQNWYRKALDLVADNPNLGYGIGNKFQQYTLLDQALEAYRLAMERNPELDFNFQIARIYGEQGKIGDMYEAYANLLAQRPSAMPNVIRVWEAFISPDPAASNNQMLRRVLLTRAQKNPDPLWNELLSWLFLQQGQFTAALVQEKALFKRSEGTDLERISNLGRLAEEAGDLGAAKAAYDYVEAESGDPVTRLNAQLRLIEIGMRMNPETDLQKVRKTYETLLQAYGYAAPTLQLQVAYARFLAFELGEAEQAVTLLKNSLDLPLPNYTQGYLKLTLGDILVFDQRFNEALILYTQVQRLLKNDVMGQEARFKVAQTSFYKGDFDWALTQLKVLRNSTSQLIANDAMQLSLTISDNSLEDSTRTALGKYARADLLAYQKKPEQALGVLEDLLEMHKGERIEDEALLMYGRLLEAAGDFSGARLSYLKIVEFYPGDILADDALFALAELYRTRLQEPEQAMEYYRRIIYNHQDSYYFPLARRQFRILRGDTIEDL